LQVLQIWHPHIV